MGISLSQTWLYIGKIIMGCYLGTYVLELGIWLGHIRWHTKKIIIIGWSTHVLGMGIGLGQSRLYIGKIFIGCYLCLGNDRSSHLLEWMNGGLHAYLHPYISTPMYIYTIHSPIPYHIRQWGNIMPNFNPNTQYHTTPRGNFTDKLGTKLSCSRNFLIKFHNEISLYSFIMKFPFKVSPWNFLIKFPHKVWRSAHGKAGTADEQISEKSAVKECLIFKIL